MQPGVTVTALLTVGESMPRTGSPGQWYRMVGIPDGLGAFAEGQDRVELFMNHELSKWTPSSPVAGEPARYGAFVSLYELRPSDQRIVSGGPAYDELRRGMSPTPIAGALSGLCSSFLAGRESGFDRSIYLTGEEATGLHTLDGLGGSGLAIIDHVAYILPGLGHFSKENLIVAPGTGDRTVIFGFEDKQGGMESQLYMYVGMKDGEADHPLARNGLIGGKLYVPPLDTGPRDEAAFKKADGVLTAQWVEIADAETLTDRQLDEASHRARAFNFCRLEDGAPDRQRRGTIYFVTTGDADPNQRGRVYQLGFDPNDPVAGSVSLRVLLEGDAGDPIVSPDNLDTDASGAILIQEDITGRWRGHLPNAATPRFGCIAPRVSG